MAWQNVKWQPIVSYQSNGAEISSSAHVHYSIYASHVFKGEPYSISEGNTICKLNPLLYIKSDNTKSGTLLIVVKEKDKLLAKDTISFSGMSITKKAYIDTLFSTSGKVWVEYYADKSTLSCLDSVKAQFINQSNKEQILKSDAYSSKDYEGFGNMYRGWGQFIYNASGDRYSKSINESLLQLPDNKEADMNPLTTAFIQMTPDENKTYLIGQNPYTWIKGDTLSASRLTEQDVVLENPFSNLINQNIEYGAIGAILEQKSFSASALTAVSIYSGSASTGNTKTLISFADMNGDGYPDILGENTIDYTGTVGSAGFPVYSHSPTATPVAQGKKIAETKVAAEAARASVSMDISTPWNKDHAETGFVDVNGDGLMDKVHSDKRVQLNMGYSFSEAVEWDIDEIRKGESSTATGSISGSGGTEYFNDVGESLGSSSYGGGISYSKTSSRQEYSLQDVNGDGLPDRLRLATNPMMLTDLYVALNTGNGFDDEIKWEGAGSFSSSSSSTRSVNTAVTTPISIPLFNLKLTPVNPTSSYSHTMSRSLTALRDVDGDGYPDYVSSDEDKKMTVKRSTIARTNKLKEVQNPLGGSFILNYKRTAATYNHPGGKWVMASLEISDGISDDGANSLTHFDYADGKRDRYEREFLGFGKVVSKQIDTENRNAFYRSVEQTYDVSNYYTSGNKLSTTLKDSEDKIYTHNTQEYYTYKVLSNSDNYNFTEVDSLENLSGVIIFSPLKFSQNQNHEGGSGKAILQQSHYSYRNGATGELISYKFSDNGSLSPNGSGSFNYQTTIIYSDNADKRILGLPSKVQVTGGDGNLYRETTATYDDFGRITELSQRLEKGKATSNFEWDKFGNITKRTMPENSNGQRMFYQYKYERDYNMYPIRIEDAWGYRSELEDYDYRYGIPLRTKDMNGYYQEQEIDNIGRITQITAPNELAEGAPYTIRFSYHKAQISNEKLENPAYATSSHYDPEHPDNPINTTTFVDGIGRAIQVKKDGVVYSNGKKTEVSIVSGRNYFDSFGRAVKSYYPTTSNLADYEKINTKFDDISPTITTFDLMDRALQIQMPDGTQTTNAYSVEGNLQLVKTTDAEGGEQVSYINGSGLNIKIEQLSGPNGIITTSFKYDAINQLLQSIDTKGNIIESKYDIGGRRTSVTHPDAGTSTFTYDNLGNVLTRQTANLADSSKFISYKYDYHRLTAINYPYNPENNVKYHYGNKYANHNRIGRLALQEDATGAQEFFYGHMGELTKVRRTHIIPNHAVATFEMQWKYDSWNRVQEMIYPDKEKLSYHYDAGGQLEGLTGNKAYSYNYVQDIGYDKFGQRTYIKYCNGTETTYNYDAKMRRLQGLQAKNQSVTFMDNAYSFDKVGNILKVSNVANAGKIGGQMLHNYSYNGLYRLSEASGNYTGSGNKVASYSLEMGYDNMHNITSKKQHIAQTDVAFAGNLLAGYELEYNYRSDKPHQLAYINDDSYRTADSTAIASSTKAISDAYLYDSNGNLVFVNTNDSVQSNIKERQLLWDEENRLRSICDNGYISSYFYDAGGERTVKLHGSGEGIHVNSAFSGGYTNNVDYTLYVDAYMVLEKGGGYTKHIYIGDQRIVSKLGDVGSFGVDPRREQYAGEEVSGVPYLITKASTQPCKK